METHLKEKSHGDDTQICLERRNQANETQFCVEIV